MSKRKLAFIILLCAMSLLITSCGPGQILGPEFTPTPTSTFTPTPTSTLSPTPTSTITPTPEDTPTPTATIGPTPSIAGVLEPWTAKTPIAGRHLALCKVSDTPEKLRCELMDWSIQTGENGEFKFFDIPAGDYLLIHDSGIGSFEEAIKKWGGREIASADPDWCDEYFGYYGAMTGWVTVHVPQGIDLNMEHLKTYGQFSLGIGDSPFILAHYPEDQNPDNTTLLRLVTIKVVDGEITQLSFPITYYGN